MLCRSQAHVECIRGFQSEVTRPHKVVDLNDYAAKKREALKKAETLREQRKRELEGKGPRTRKYSWGGLPAEGLPIDYTWTKPDEDPRTLQTESSLISVVSSSAPRTPKQRRKPPLDTNLGDASSPSVSRWTRENGGSGEGESGTSTPSERSSVVRSSCQSLPDAATVSRCLTRQCHDVVALEPRSAPRNSVLLEGIRSPAAASDQGGRGEIGGRGGCGSLKGEIRGRGGCQRGGIASPCSGDRTPPGHEKGEHGFLSPVLCLSPRSTFTGGENDNVEGVDEVFHGAAAAAAAAAGKDESAENGLQEDGGVFVRNGSHGEVPISPSSLMRDTRASAAKKRPPAISVLKEFSAFGRSLDRRGDSGQWGSVRNMMMKSSNDLRRSVGSLKEISGGGKAPLCAPTEMIARASKMLQMRVVPSGNERGAKCGVTKENEAVLKTKKKMLLSGVSPMSSSVIIERNHFSTGATGSIGDGSAKKGGQAFAAVRQAFAAVPKKPSAASSFPDRRGELSQNRKKSSEEMGTRSSRAVEELCGRDIHNGSVDRGTRGRISGGDGGGGAGLRSMSSKGVGFGKSCRAVVAGGDEIASSATGKSLSLKSVVDAVEAKSKDACGEGKRRHHVGKANDKVRGANGTEIGNYSHSHRSGSTGVVSSVSTVGSTGPSVMPSAVKSSNDCVYRKAPSLVNDRTECAIGVCSDNSDLETVMPGRTDDESGNEESTEELVLLEVAGDVDAHRAGDNRLLPLVILCKEEMAEVDNVEEAESRCRIMDNTEEEVTKARTKLHDADDTGGVSVPLLGWSSIGDGRATEGEEEMSSVSQGNDSQRDVFVESAGDCGRATVEIAESKIVIVDAIETVGETNDLNGAGHDERARGSSSALSVWMIGGSSDVHQSASTKVAATEGSLVAGREEECRKGTEGGHSRSTMSVVSSGVVEHSDVGRSRAAEEEERGGDRVREDSVGSVGEMEERDDTVVMEEVGGSVDEEERLLSVEDNAAAASRPLSRGNGKEDCCSEEEGETADLGGTEQWTASAASGGDGSAENHGTDDASLHREVRASNEMEEDLVYETGLAKLVSESGADSVAEDGTSGGIRCQPGQEKAATSNRFSEERGECAEGSLVKFQGAGDRPDYSKQGGEQWQDAEMTEDKTSAVPENNSSRIGGNDGAEIEEEREYHFGCSGGEMSAESSLEFETPSMTTKPERKKRCGATNHFLKSIEQWEKSAEGGFVTKDGRRIGGDGSDKSVGSISLVEAIRYTKRVMKEGGRAERNSSIIPSGMPPLPVRDKDGSSGTPGKHGPPNRYRLPLTPAAPLLRSPVITSCNSTNSYIAAAAGNNPPSCGEEGSCQVNVSPGVDSRGTTSEEEVVVENRLSDHSFHGNGSLGESSVTEMRGDCDTAENQTKMQEARGEAQARDECREQQRDEQQKEGGESGNSGGDYASLVCQTTGAAAGEAMFACPDCGRRFNQASLKRHVLFCKASGGGARIRPSYRILHSEAGNNSDHEQTEAGEHGENPAGEAVALEAIGSEYAENQP